MAMKSITARLRNLIRDFAAAREGNIAIIFAVVTLPVVGMMGAAVDYSRANAVKADLQSALDATALMVSKNAATLDANELQNKAEAYFNALFKSSEAGTTTIVATYLPDTSTVTINGNSTVKSDFMAVMGSHFANMPIGGTSSVSWGSSRLRVALALDNTGSMASSNKMTALKTAAKNLLLQLESAAQKDGDVYVSIVPFSKDVNVGTGARTSDWLDWREWNKENGRCSDRDYDTQKKCKQKDKTWTSNNHNTWTGCVTDREQDFDISNSAPDVKDKDTLFVAEQYQDCPEALMPLSYNWAALKTKIEHMTPVGNTNVTIGLSWGWQSLTEGAPLFAPAEDSKYKYQKVLILLTDGQNTENRWSTSQTQIDDRTKKACAKAKAAGVTIYTVRVMDGSESLLRTCATDPNKYFHLQSADGLVGAFNQIGTELTSLRLSN